MVLIEAPKSNRLLVALADTDPECWERSVERVELSLGQMLTEPGRPPRHAYFPGDAIVSLFSLVSEGESAEFAVVGNEGLVGTSLYLGGVFATSHSSVLIAGQGFRVGAQVLTEAFERSDAARLLLLRYAQALATQIGQTAVCNRLHTIEQQLCNWLLHVLDRQGHGEVVITQGLIAGALGVRRESVTEAAGRLQAAGIIRCARGRISVLDRVRLERRCCECHAVLKKEYDRLLPPASAIRPAAWRAWPLAA